MTGWREPARLAAGAAVRFVRRHGILRAIRLASAGLAAVGARGVVRRAAADARLREDDARYGLWAAAHTPTDADLRQLAAEAARWPARPRVSIVTAVFNTRPEWLRRCVESVRAQVYPDWELCVCDDGSTDAATSAALEAFRDDPKIRILRSVSNGGVVQASNAALTLARGDYVGFLDHDDELAPDALAEIARRLIAEPDLDIVYTDEDKIDSAAARREPHFKPDWSPELLRSCMYLSHFTIARRSLIQAAGGFRDGTDGAQDYDLALRITPGARVAHVPKVLYHWRATAGSAASSQLGKPWAVAAGRRALEEDARRRGLAALVTSAGAAGHYRVRYAVPGAPTVATVRHDARQFPPTADHLLFLDADVRSPSREALEALLELSQLEEIGAVGGLMLRPDGTIDSAGLVLGPDGVPRPAFRGEPHWTRGHLSNVLDVRNCSAVSGACLMTRRSVFEQVGGLDAAVGLLWDVDYCLRVQAAGLRVAVTPHARLHRDPPDTAPDPDPVALARLRERWGPRLVRDPYYNPNFDQRAASFRLGSP